MHTALVKGSGCSRGAERAPAVLHAIMRHARMTHLPPCWQRGQSLAGPRPTALRQLCHTMAPDHDARRAASCFQELHGAPPIAPG
eukprot:363295-Chlamydomonas_euryale.AAC.1